MSLLVLLLLFEPLSIVSEKSTVTGSANTGVAVVVAALLLDVADCAAASKLRIAVSCIDNTQG